MRTAPAARRTARPADARTWRCARGRSWPAPRRCVTRAPGAADRWSRAAAGDSVPDRACRSRRALPAAWGRSVSRSVTNRAIWPSVDGDCLDDRRHIRVGLTNFLAANLPFQLEPAKLSENGPFIGGQIVGFFVQRAQAIGRAPRQLVGLKHGAAGCWASSEAVTIGANSAATSERMTMTPQRRRVTLGVFIISRMSTSDGP